MKTSKIVLVLASLAGITQSAWSQTPNGVSGHGILGYLDTRTGAFKPMIQSPTESDQTASALAALSPTAGKLVFNITINVASSFPSNAVITCVATAQVTQAVPFVYIQEEAGTMAARAGSKATCTVTLPYSWPLSNVDQDTVTLAYTISANSATTVLRSSLVSLPSIKVPTTGSTTTQAISATI